MSLRRLGQLAVVALATIICISCGQVFRPVVLPTNTVPPNPANYHAVFGISTNAGSNPGTALQIDVSGDANIGVDNMGLSPTHAATLPNNSRVFVASAGGSQCPPAADVVTAFTPVPPLTVGVGLGTPFNFSMPIVGTAQSSAIASISETGNLVTVTLASAFTNARAGAAIVVAGVSVTGYNGCFSIFNASGNTIQYVDATSGLAPVSGGAATATVPAYCPYLPDFVATTQNNAVYVANYGAENGLNCGLSSTDSVAQLSPATNIVANLTYLAAGSHPVAMAETPNAMNLYVVNQGNDTVTDLSPTDMSTIATIQLPAGSSTPVWAVARPDNLRVYVVTQGDGKLYTINTVTNAVDQGVSVGGAGANFVLYDKSRNRLYVTNPTAGAVYVFDATADPPALIAGSPIVMNTGANPPCPTGCSPVSVTALPDGSRFYVASYQLAAACPDLTIGATEACIIPRLTVFDAPSLTVKSIALSYLTPSLSLLTSPPFAAAQYAVPVVSSCAPTATYAPGSTRFRMFTTSAADSSHVYVSICDAGSIADINASTSNGSLGGNNTPDMLITDIAPPAANCSGVSCGTVASITGYSVSSGVVTFQAANNFTAGQQISVAGLTSKTGVLFDDQNYTVLAAGLSNGQFACNVPPGYAGGNVSPMADAGTATPLAPTQSPIFLLTGQ